MKDCYEIAENVFRRRDDYNAKQASQKQRIRKVINTICVLVLAILLVSSLGTCYVFAVGLGIAEDPLGLCDQFITVDTAEDTAVPFGDTVISDDISVTAKSAFTDGTTAIIRLNIVAPEDIDLDQPGLHFDMDFRNIIRGDNPSKRLGSGDSGMTYYTIEDGDGKNNTQEMMIRVYTTSLPKDGFSFADGYDRYVTLNGLYVYKEEYPYTKHQLSDGKWNFRIRFDDGFTAEKELLDGPINLTVYRAIYDAKQKATVHSIFVRGLSIQFTYTYAAGAVKEPGDLGDVKVVMKDGTVIEATRKMGVSSEDGDFISTYLATTPINVEAIDYLQVGDCFILNGQITHQGNVCIPVPRD